MTGVVIVTNDEGFTHDIQQAFRQQAPNLPVFLPHEPGAEQADVAACWFPDASLLKRFPRVRLLHALSAGVDHLGPSLLDAGLPVCRVVDQQQKQGMLEYAVWAVLHYHRHFDQVLANQGRGHWHMYAQLAASQIQVGVMGLGEIGSYVAQGLLQLGYQVSGWARQPKNLPGVTAYVGKEGLAGFLGQTDILINLLPLTDETIGILSAPLFRQLPAGAVVVNIGRGGHLVMDDLLSALAGGHLRAALLDVFPQEPLAADDPLWHTPGLTITPHMASAASVPAIVRQVAENARRLQAGDVLLNTVDTSRGY